ncbi:hypothetical protein ACFL6C_07745 [Myxococcota bacterium]
MSASEILSMRLGVLEKAFVEFYSETYGKSQAEIVRTMISKYVNSDKAFKADAFNRFVKNKIAPVIEDKELREELLRVTRDYVGTRKAVDGPTLAGSKGK